MVCQSLCSKLAEGVGEVSTRKVQLAPHPQGRTRFTALVHVPVRSTVNTELGPGQPIGRHLAFQERRLDGSLYKLCILGPLCLTLLFSSIHHLSLGILIDAALCRCQAESGANPYLPFLSLPVSTV